MIKYPTLRPGALQPGRPRPCTGPVRDLHGKGSKEYRTVEQAWGAVNVG
ncbi:hypothetical protein [Streptomyces sp. NPDC090021]